MSGGGERPERRVVSAAGREVLAAAVRIDQSWSMRFSAEDKLIEAVSGLSDEDLEGAALMTHYLHEAVVCAQIRRDTDRLRRDREDGEAGA